LGVCENSVVLNCLKRRLNLFCFVKLVITLISVYDLKNLK
jgi:hypothetical protein